MRTLGIDLKREGGVLGIDFCDLADDGNQVAHLSGEGVSCAEGEEGE